MDFNTLVSTIQTANTHLHQNAIKAVNVNISLRNWLIGYYIVEFEQKGEDRAVYGSNLLNLLEKKLNIKGLTSPELSRCRQFYSTYSGFLGAIILKFRNLLSEKILGSVTQEFQENAIDTNLGSLTQDSEVVIRGSLPPNYILLTIIIM